jgi:putative transposase
MALLRWAAGVIEAGGYFRRVNGHLHLTTLRFALERQVAEQRVGVNRHDVSVNAA